MISILIRNKNEGLALKNALQSIQLQKLIHPYEVVVVDDNSTDESIEIAKRYNCNIVKLEKEFSYGYAINFGLQFCKYDIVLLLSSHNILLSSNFLEILIEYFNDSAVAGVRCTPVSNSKQIEQSLYKELVISKENYTHQTDWSNLLIANCSAISKKVALNILFNESIRSNEEKLWSIEALEKSYIIYSNVPCYYIYNKINKPSALNRDLISKYQIDGITELSLYGYLFFLLKAIPWTIKIALKNLKNNFKTATLKVTLPIKYKKGLYN